MSLAEWSRHLADLQPLLDWREVPLDLLSLSAVAAGLGWASGLRLYALVFALGALERWGGVQLPSGLHVLSDPLVLGVAGFMLVLEFFADKVMWVDSLWDTVHTFIRIPAGAALAAAMVGGEDPAVQIAMALVGGSLAAGTHLAKAGGRAALNTLPEPFTNIGASLGEDVLFVGGLWLLLTQPLYFLMALLLFMLVAVALIVLLWRFLRVLFRRRSAVA